VRYKSFKKANIRHPKTQLEINSPVCPSHDIHAHLSKCLPSKQTFTSNGKITMGGLRLSVRMSFAKKMDDHVVYF
jgi:hypothetical protein